MEQRRNDPCRCGSGRKYKKCCAEAMTEQGSEVLGRAAELVREGAARAAAELFLGTAAVERDGAGAFYQLGVALKERGLVAEGAVCYQQALGLRPDYVEALNNLGVIKKEQKDFAEAAGLLQRALQLRPEAAIIHYNLGVVLVGLGHNAEAKLSFARTLEFRPDYVEAHYNLGMLAKEEGAWESAIASLRRAVELRADYPRAQTALAILAWQQGNFAECAFCLEQISHRRGKLMGDEEKFVEPYRSFLGKLLAYRRSHGELYQGEVALPVLYAIGDSHCLAPAHLPVVLGAEAYRVEARIVVGAKAWHLGQKQPNRYQRSLEKIVATIPAGAAVLGLFGEIDCRLDEGIIPHHRKTANDLTSAISELVENYVTTLARLCESRSLKPMFANVPAPTLQNAAATIEERQLQAMVIREFNRALASRCAIGNFPVVDVYQASVRPDGLAQEHCHLDLFHLKPALYQELLGKL